MTFRINIWNPMVPLRLLNSNDPRHDLNQPAPIPNVTPILNLSRIFSMCVNLVLNTLKLQHNLFRMNIHT